ncbi:MAG: aryl-sulfate sulfotransferase [Akkermansiaceae bacterium]|nr:aryl-sulfate sulfotransferase [Akkermansiaceae bacterium]
MKQAMWLAAMLAFGGAMAKADGITGEVGGKLLASGNGVMILSAAGEVEWQHSTGLTHDAWLLANGNVLYADGDSVTEVTREHKVVFQYKAAEQRGGGTYACQRLANGNTMIGENSTGKVLEVDPAGKVVFELQTSQATPGEHHNMRMARKLKNGNYLVCHSGAHLAKEYTPKGEVVLELKTANIAFSAIRTAAETTMVGALDKIIEFDAQGKVVWEFSAKDIPGVTIRNMTGMHLLPNGNIVTGCYAAYDNNEGCGLLEITKEKKLVWRLSNPKLGSSMMAGQKLTADGLPLPGDCLR